MSRRYAKVLGVVALLALLTSLAVYVIAQPPGGFQPGGQPGGQGQMFRMMMRGGGGAAIAVAGDAVFVVANGMLLKYDANTLELLAQADLPLPEPPAGAPPAGQPGPGQ